MSSSNEPDSFFERMAHTVEFDPQAGFTFSGGVRAFIMSASTIDDLIDDLYLVFGFQYVNARLYLGGKRAGKRTAAALTTKYNVDTDDKPTCEQFFSDFYAALGWARLEFELDYAQAAGTVIAHNSFLAQGALEKFTARGTATAVKAKAQPRCEMLGGYIAGLVSFLFNAEVDAHETECLVTRAPACRFKVTHHERS